MRVLGSVIPLCLILSRYSADLWGPLVYGEQGYVASVAVLEGCETA